MKAAFLIGRAMLGGFFVYNGIHHFQQTDMIAGCAKSKDVPVPKAAVLASGAALLVGGASLITGIKPKYGIAAVLGFLGTVSPSIHDFWNIQDPQGAHEPADQFHEEHGARGCDFGFGRR